MSSSAICCRLHRNMVHTTPAVLVDMATENKAVVAINGGGFIDPNYNNSICHDHISELLDKNPKNRPTIKQILNDIKIFKNEKNYLKMIVIFIMKLFALLNSNYIFKQAKIVNRSPK